MAVVSRFRRTSPDPPFPVSRKKCLTKKDDVARFPLDATAGDPEFGVARHQGNGQVGLPWGLRCNVMWTCKAKIRSEPTRRIERVQRDPVDDGAAHTPVPHEQMFPERADLLD